MLRSHRARRALGAIGATVMLGLPLAAVAPAAATEPVEAEATAAVATSSTSQIKRLYLSVFDRPADQPGLDYWLAQLEAGSNMADVAHAFLNGAEWAMNSASLSNEDYVELVYNNALNRASDEPGRNYWLDRLAEGMARAEMVLYFSDSQEQINAVGGTDLDLNILHVNDHHSRLEATDIDLPFGDGREANVEMGGFGRVAGAIKMLETALEGENVVKIHAGDAITGTLYYSLFKGEADAAVMNEVCFDVFEVGNHEFDDGDAGLAQFLDWLNEGDCGTVTLGANVVPEVGTPLAPSSPTDYLQPYWVESYDGVEVGYVGLDIAQKTMVSSSPLDSTMFLDEVETAQRYIDELTEDGVRNIVLVTHYQYANDLELASMVSGVDVIVGGDSHSLLGDDFAAIGLDPEGPYPTMATDADGVRVCVVQAWQYSNIVGQLAVSFDEFGEVTSCDGTPHLLLGDTFVEEGDEEDVTLEGADADLVQAVIDGNPSLTQVTPDAATEAVIAEYSDQVEELSTAVIGEATEDLCLARVPNDGRSEIPGCETPNGGDIQQLVTDAFLARAFRAEIALQNSGGVRIDIPEGDITIGDAYTLLPFANTMVEMELTGAELTATLEEGVANWLDNEGSSGAYPYGAGIRWDLDLNEDAGSRFTNVEVKPKGTDTWVAIDPTATYIVVTNSFMASGGDGYTTMGEKFDAGEYVDTFLDYAQTFIDYVEQDAEGSISRPTEYSTQNFVGLQS